MRVLLVSHLYPPAHHAGTEVYTAELAKRLVDKGIEVCVFTTDKDIGLADLTLRERRHEGVRVIELVNNLFYEDFEDTWKHPRIEALFRDVLRELAPDVVHFQHLLYLSVGLLGEARASGARVLFTLHDFWLSCPRLGQLVHGDGTICYEVDFERCGTCLPTFKWAQTGFERRAGRAIAKVHRATGVDLGPLARGARRVLHGRKARPEAAPPEEAEVDTTEQTSYASLARERSGALRETVLAHVDRFVSPSEFLRARFIEWGIPADRIEHVPTGIDLGSFTSEPRERRNDRDPLRVLFLGTLVPLKGADVLVEAWGALPSELRDRAELVIHGPSEHAPDYCARLAARAADVGATLGGALDHDEVPGALEAADVVVVPSVWFENRPLVLLEALATRTALVVSDLGGMAEVVEEGETGWHFPVGDHRALAARLGALIEDPTSLDRLYRRAVHLPDWATFTERMLDLYGGPKEVDARG